LKIEQEKGNQLDQLQKAWEIASGDNNIYFGERSPSLRDSGPCEGDYLYVHWETSQEKSAFKLKMN